METVPIRADSARHDTVPNFVRSGTPQYGTVPYSIVPDANHLELIYPSTVQFKSILSTILVPLTVPLTFVQGLQTSKRSNTHCKNKYKKKMLALCDTNLQVYSQKVSLDGTVLG